MDNQASRVAAIIPAYQAGATVGSVAAETLKIVPNLLVVDDGSTDGTAEAAREVGAEVLVLPVNLGKGAALRAGFEQLFDQGFDEIVTLDADGQHLPAEIPKLLDLAGQGELILGVRDHLFAQMSPLRRNSNAMSSRIITTVAGLPFMDVQTGFRLYQRRLIEAVGFSGQRFEAETAVLVRAARAGFRIRSTPVDLGQVDGHATSHFRPVLDAVRIFFAVCSARLGRRTW